MANPTTNSQYLAKITTNTTLPLPVSISGTFVTSGTTVTGTGTKFTSECVVGDWIFNAATYEVRRIDFIVSDTLLAIESAFTSDIGSGIDIKVPLIPRVKQISVANEGGASGKINGVAFLAGATANWGKEARTKTGAYDYVDPICIDGTGTSIQASLLY